MTDWAIQRRCDNRFGVLRDASLSRRDARKANPRDMREWSDAVMVHPRPLTGDGRDAYILEMSEQLGFDPKWFDSCMFAAETVAAAQAVFVEARKRRVLDTPTYVVDDEPLNVAELLELIDERL